MSDRKFECGLFPIVSLPQQTTDHKFECGLFPIVSSSQPQTVKQIPKLEPAPILVDESELYMNTKTNTTPTTEFHREKPLEVWSPYMTYPEQRIIRLQNKNRESWMALLYFIADAIAIAIIFTLLFLFS
jgi:hypothetical protein